MTAEESALMGRAGRLVARWQDEVQRHDRLVGERRRTDPDRAALYCPLGRGPAVTP